MNLFFPVNVSHTFKYLSVTISCKVNLSFSLVLFIVPTDGLKVCWCSLAQTMKFRQRIAWVAIIAYLAATCGLFFYIFEINETYNRYALDHHTQFHPNPILFAEQRWNRKQQKTLQEEWKFKSELKKPDPHTVKAMVWHRIFSHLTDIPLPVWLLLLLLPYLQVFFMLLACTKTDPRQSIALLWPGIFYLKFCHQNTSSVHNNIGKSKKNQKLNQNGTLSNGNNAFNM